MPPSLRRRRSSRPRPRSPSPVPARPWPGLSAGEAVPGLCSSGRAPTLLASDPDFFSTSGLDPPRRAHRRPSPARAGHLLHLRQRHAAPGLLPRPLPSPATFSPSGKHDTGPPSAPDHPSTAARRPSVQVAPGDPSAAPDPVVPGDPVPPPASMPTQASLAPCPRRRGPHRHPALVLFSCQG
ncbi:hypothetical protein EJB05_23646, partial [Eragrostis curvula]